MRKTAFALGLVVCVAACSKNKGDGESEGPAENSSAEEGEDPVNEPRRETVELKHPIRESVAKVSVEVPAGWIPAERISGGPAWRPEGGSETYFQLTRTCGGKCDLEAIPGNVEKILQAKRDGIGGVGPTTESRYEPVETEIVTDEKRGLGHLIHRRIAAVRGLPPRFNVLCLAREEKMPFIVALAGIGDQKDEEAHLPAILAACESLRIDDWN